MNELPTIEDIRTDEIFAPAGEKILKGIEEAARSIPVDISTEPGRKACASTAHKIAKLKTGIDAIGKVMVADWKARSAKIDAQRRAIWDRLEALQAEIRRPLTDFEQSEASRVADHEARIAAIGAAADFLGPSPTADEIQARLIAIASDMQRDWQEFGKRATEVADTARAALQKQLDSRKKYDAEQAELARLRIEAEQRERLDRERKIAEEAAAKAKAEAEAKAEVERSSQAKKEAAAQAAADAAIQRAKDAEAAALKAAQDAETAAKEAADRADRARDEAIKAERTKQEQARKDAQEAAAKREADVQHRSKINRAALAAIVEVSSVTDEQAKAIVEAIARGKIPNVVISY